MNIYNEQITIKTNFPNTIQLNSSIPFFSNQLFCTHSSYSRDPISPSGPNIIQICCHNDTTELPITSSQLSSNNMNTSQSNTTIPASTAVGIGSLDTHQIEKHYLPIRHFSNDSTPIRPLTDSPEQLRIPSTVPMPVRRLHMTDNLVSIPGSAENTHSMTNQAVIANKQVDLMPNPVTNIKHKNLSRFLHTDLGNSIMIDRLREGFICLKHGTRGTAHYRIVWCSTDLREVYWGELKTKKIRGSILSDTILSVEKGHTTKLFKERAPKSCDPNRCFSLRTTTRTLDLEAISDQERDLWALTFEFLLDYIAKQGIPSQTTSLPPTPVHGRRYSLVNALEVLCDHSISLSQPNSPTRAIRSESDPPPITHTPNGTSQPSSAQPPPKPVNSLLTPDKQDQSTKADSITPVQRFQITDLPPDPPQPEPPLTPLEDEQTQYRNFLIRTDPRLRRLQIALNGFYEDQHQLLLFANKKHSELQNIITELQQKNVRLLTMTQKFERINNCEQGIETI